jgi:putative transcriptional regulator
MENGMPIRLRIGEVAREHGLTIKALAARAGVAYNTAHALYTGRALRIDLDTLDRICAALQAEPGDLFVRQVAEEPAGQGQDGGGSYGTDSDRPAGAGDRPAAGP